jgi:fumarate hydratase class II
MSDREYTTRVAAGRTDTSADGAGADGKRKTRVERDAMGDIEVLAERYWGAQTERSLKYFSIGEERMPLALIRALAQIKKAAAIVNRQMGKLKDDKKADLIIQAADEVIEATLPDGETPRDHRLLEEFPLFVYQTGSGTQTNMNVNEVIANRAIELAGGRRGTKDPIHPNDDVNMSQSSNDTFPAAMHMAAVEALSDQLLPSVAALKDAIALKAGEWMKVLKIGRTHLQDATPITVGQEWSGYVTQLEDAMRRIQRSLDGLYELALGGTAVGTGLDSPRGFDLAVAAEIAELTHKPFVTAPNKFAALASIDALVASMSAVRALAVALFKIAQDIRLLGSGPRAGLGELKLPENEPGSSIMPGKVNPTQCEAMLMVCIQVMGDDVTVGLAGSQGNFELNVMRPVAINAFLRSTRLLTDACRNFRAFCVEGIELNDDTIERHLHESLMLVTALKQHIGYDNAAAIAKLAHKEKLTLHEAAFSPKLKSEVKQSIRQKLGRDMTPQDFERWVRPEEMIHPDD